MADTYLHGHHDSVLRSHRWRTAGPADRSWWGLLWAERLTDSPFGGRAIEHHLATRADLERLARAWLRWAASEDAWFVIPHGEILCRV